MEMVVDASALLAVLLNEESRETIIAATHGVALISPESLPFEIGNAVSALLKRTALSVPDAVAVFHAYSRIALRLVPVDIPASILIAGKFSLYAYDAYLLQAAEAYHCPLLTLDRRLADAACAQGVDVVELGPCL